MTIKRKLLTIYPNENDEEGAGNRYKKKDNIIKNRYTKWKFMETIYFEQNGDRMAEI